MTRNIVPQDILDGCSLLKSSSRQGWWKGEKGDKGKSNSPPSCSGIAVIEDCSIKIFYQDAESPIINGPTLGSLTSVSQRRRPSFVGGCLCLRASRDAQAFSLLQQVADHETLLPEEGRFLPERTLSSPQSIAGTFCSVGKPSDSADIQKGSCAKKGPSRPEMGHHPSSRCERLCIALHGAENDHQG